jgi:hypothetical protein
LGLGSSGGDRGHASHGENHGCEFHFRFQNFTWTVFEPTTWA